MDEAALHPAQKETVPPWLRIFSAFVPADMQNTADDIRPQSDHFEKFLYIKGDTLPATWLPGEPTTAGKAAQKRLRDDFAELCRILQAMMRGEPAEFGPAMFQLHGDIVGCWKHGAIPTFS